MRAPRWSLEARPEAGAPFGGAGEAMHAVSRLLESATHAEGPQAVAETLVREARAFFRVCCSAFVTVAEAEGRVEVVAVDPQRARPALLALTELPPLATVLAGRDEIRMVEGAEAAALMAALGGGPGADTALLLPMRTGESHHHVLVLGERSERVDGGRLRMLDEEDLEVAHAFAAAAAAGVAQVELAAQSAARGARQAALARAAHALSESLELNRVLMRICEEAASILESDYANVFLGNATEGLRFEATWGLPPALIGERVEAGQGLVGKSVQRDQPMLTNDYQALPRPVKLEPFDRVRSSLAVPMHWDGELRGALAIGYFRSQLVTGEDLALLEAFADLAAAACRNASVYAGLELAARTDGLTGCLNHSAMQDALRVELERCRRVGHALSLAIVDLDDFKQVNERHGHLAGDEVLRRVGQALRRHVRPYDLVARYGGDEFAIVAIDADERVASEVATRAIAGVRRAVERLDYAEGSGGATAGVAEWREDESPNALIGRADRALLFGKHRGSRGVAVRESDLPAGFEPEGNERSSRAPGGGDSDDAHAHAAQLRRRTRQLDVLSALARRLTGSDDPAEIVGAAVAELDGTFKYFLSAVLCVREEGHLESVAARGVALERLGVDGWTQPLGSGLLGRALAREGSVRTGDMRTEPDYRLVPGMADVNSMVAVPIRVGEGIWGALDVEELRADAFDDEDVRFFEAIADQVGLALRAAGVTPAAYAADSESSS